MVNNIKTCNNSKEEVIVLKAQNKNIENIIKYNIYASTNAPAPERNFTEFILIGETDALGTRVFATGIVNSITKIGSKSRVSKIFSSASYNKWSYEYTLTKVNDLSSKFLYITDVFLPKDINKVRYTQQFTFVEK